MDPALLRPPPDRLLAVREVAGRLGLCRATGYALCAEGKLPHLRISTHAIRVPEVALP